LFGRSARANWALPTSYEKQPSALPGREAEIELRTSAGLTSPEKIPPRPATGQNPRGVAHAPPHFPPFRSRSTSRAPRTLTPASAANSSTPAGAPSPRPPPPRRRPEFPRLASAAPATTPVGAPSPRLGRRAPLPHFGQPWPAELPRMGRHRSSLATANTATASHGHNRDGQPRPRAATGARSPEFTRRDPIAFSTGTRLLCILYTGTWLLFYFVCRGLNTFYFYPGVFVQILDLLSISHHIQPTKQQMHSAYLNPHELPNT
jgi:hypothetical protein